MTALFGGSGSEGIKYYCIVQVVLEIQGIRTCLLFVPLIYNTTVVVVTPAVPTAAQ